MYFTKQKKVLTFLLKHIFLALKVQISLDFAKPSSNQILKSYLNYLTLISCLSDFQTFQRVHNLS